MGCFNTTGFISKLPIRCGDRVVCFIASENPDRNLRELFLPDALIAPWGLPVRGKYDDYGSVEQIDRNFNVEIIEKICDGTDIEQIYKGVERCLYGDDGNVDSNIKYWKDNKEELKLYKPLLKLYGDSKDYIKKINKMIGSKYKTQPSIFLLFEHEAIYDEITSKDIKWGYSWEEGTDINVLIEHQDRMMDLEDEASEIIDVICGIDDMIGEKDTLKILTGYPNIFSRRHIEYSPLKFSIDLIIKESEEKKSNRKNPPTPEQIERLTAIQSELEELYRNTICFGGEGRSVLFMKEFDMLRKDTDRKMLVDERDEIVRFVKLMIWLSRMPMVITPSKTGDQDHNPRGFVELYDYLHKFSEKYFEEDIKQEEYESQFE